jgi:hypothetical protein
MSSACSECGFDRDTVSVPDAILTFRSMPRRWKGALALVDDEDDEVLRRRPADGSPSALEHAEAARDALGGASGGDVVDAITAAAEQRAAETERVDPDEWRDPARLGALLDTVHAVVHHLRAAQRAVDAARHRR